ADLNVGQALDDQPTLITRLNLAHVILEALQRRDDAVVDHCAVAQDADTRVSCGLAVEHVQSGGHLARRQPERLAHLGVAVGNLPDLRRQQAGHRRLNVVHQLVDDVVEADVDPAASAARLAAASGRTLNPTMIALEATARFTSDSEMAPVPAWTTLTPTDSDSSLSFARVPWIASSEPWTSALST